MAYLNIEKLKAGTLYKTDKDGVTIYFKMVDDTFMIGFEDVDDDFIVTTNLGHFTHGDWEEVSFREVKALTETMKEILDNTTVDIVLTFDAEEDYHTFLEAFDNSTEFKYVNGTPLTHYIRPGKFESAVRLVKARNRVWNGTKEWYVKNGYDVLIIDFSASKSVLVDTIKIEGVVE